MKKLSLLAVLLLAGCATAGTKVDPGRVAQFEHGTTTMTQVVASLGPPQVLTNLPDGTVIAVYSYAAVRMSPAAFIPIVGLAANHTDMQSQTYSFIFKDGVLK